MINNNEILVKNNNESRDKVKVNILNLSGLSKDKITNLENNDSKKIGEGLSPKGKKFVPGSSGSSKKPVEKGSVVNNTMNMDPNDMTLNDEIYFLINCLQKQRSRKSTNFMK